MPVLLPMVVLLLTASPDPAAEIRVQALEPEAVERPPELHIDGRAQPWHEAKDGTWVHRSKLKGWHTLELKAPIWNGEGGAIQRFAAPLGPDVRITLLGHFTGASGPTGPRCLYVDAPASEASKWRLCDADPGLPMQQVIDLFAPRACPRPALGSPTFFLERKGVGSIEFFDTLPGLYRARVRDGKVELTFTPGATACERLAEGAPWVDLHQWRLTRYGRPTP